ncbi:unnamed protein product, partial [Meganyctiphanes norvegica]
VAIERSPQKVKMVRFGVIAVVGIMGLCGLCAAVPYPPECNQWCHPGSGLDKRCCELVCEPNPNMMCTQAIVCDSEGVVHPNGCDFAAAQCLNPELKQVQCDPM